MDQHPIPQDVTGFQFKLIGTMTVKQFGYVAVGVISAVVLYYLPLPGPFWFLFKLVFIPFMGGSGFIIAFVPVDGRPIDLMASNFAKSIFSPNQYVYKKTEQHFSFSSIILTKPQQIEQQKRHAPTSPVHEDNKSERLYKLLNESQGRAKNDLDKKEAAFLKQFVLPVAAPITATTNKKTQVIAPVTKTAVPQTAIPQPVQQQTAQVTTETLAKKETVLEQEIALAKKEEEAKKNPQEHTVAHQKVETLEHQLQEIHQQKQYLEQEVLRLKQQLATQQRVPAPTSPKPLDSTTTQKLAPQPQTTVTAQTPAQPQTTMDPAHVRSIAQNVTKKAGVPHVSDTPNVITGIVKDPRENVLPNILVEVKDHEGNPVRAFKTNPLGQFASATPLAAGVYTIELEDPKKLHTFKVIQITADNQIMLPIEIISQDAREALRQSLFN